MGSSYLVGKVYRYIEFFDYDSLPVRDCFFLLVALDKIINISSLISARDVKSKFPEEYCDYIEIINKYKPIGNSICNYNRILENLSVTLMIIVHAYVKEIALIIKSENSYIVQWVMWLQVI